MCRVGGCLSLHGRTRDAEFLGKGSGENSGFGAVGDEGGEDLFGFGWVGGWVGG